MMNMDDERAVGAYAAPLAHRDPSTYEGRRDMKEKRNYDSNERYDRTQPAFVSQAGFILPSRPGDSQEQTDLGSGPSRSSRPVAEHS
jgi:hypothetical protein